MKKKKMLLSQKTMDLDMVRKVEQLSGTSVRRCFQCGKCSAGCPMATFMDHPPNRIVRLLQLGQWQRILAGRSIWYCVSCETCSTRCPNQVHLASIMDALRKLSWDQDGPSKESYVQLANRLFLENIRTYGRQYEMRLAAVFNVKSGQFLKDMLLGPKLLSKGKLKVFHQKNKNMAEVEKIFSRIEEMRRKGEAL
ncbi:heterodisulfide reductase subunit C [Trichlorobacter thiogenes]|jgi:heterodisulfide reductase subunit C2|uniref:Heterodisulfide reductase subunit C n=1 Tax=Trichlorobacter thiogenes TaxID=115783 RepID=A0A1T4R5D0_9BACT|nr:4Fe-4S dicluster domain-containing protein [Trichlorobacter thiogenes]SKA11129.1 heterodisulfide reductase subunit C [Trichlorobacter thiogenes]